MKLFNKLKRNEQENNEVNQSDALTDEELELITSISVQDYHDYITESEFLQITNENKSNAMEIINSLVASRKKEAIMAEKTNQRKVK